MNSLTDITRQSLDIARAVVSLIGRRKFKLYLQIKTWSGTRIGDGTPTVLITEMGHQYAGKIYAPHINEEACGVVVAGLPEYIKLKVVGLLKNYVTSTTTGGYVPQQFSLQYQAATEFQFQVLNVDTNETMLYQLDQIHEFSTDQFDITLTSIGAQ
jgi:hypothetical protein